NTLGQPSQATAHFEDALAFCLGPHYRPEYAWACHDYAAALLGRNTPGDQVRASSLIAEALSIPTELEMTPLQGRVAALKERIESQPTRASAHPDRLSEREVEVLRLIAAGRSNREIARELYISDRTVAQHVTSILNKTGAANRTEAALYAARRGLVSS
ncbi:MAG TPA: response regulator transcription factor, partial [Dehalococcoidia bacterium]|nr:response regulator transcription factor [Dehalococcoidia bacterium]